jgi:Xaa-Pro aminopeptidase
MGNMKYLLRKRRALKAASLAGADALLVTHLPDVRYLCGFTGSAGVLSLCKGQARLFTDGRYREQATAEAVGTAISVESRPPALAAITWLMDRSTRCLFNAVHVTVAQFDLLKRALPSASRKNFFQPEDGLIARLREIKDAEEMKAMTAAANLGCRLFDHALSEIASGTTEAEIAMMLEQGAKRCGADAMSFDTIVASGERSALPHGRATSAKLPRNGFVTLDFGVVLEGYCSDMTRTVHLGKPKGEARSVYDSVLEAQLAAVAAVRAGVETGAVDEAARSVLRRAGLEEYFIHSTGHGVGLEIHEGPRIAAKQTSCLRAGMVITIEPGVYLPGRFGVRIEDMVLVTKTGGEVLTPTTKALIEL